jgi:hypothetical protein
MMMNLSKIRLTPFVLAVITLFAAACQDREQADITPPEIEEIAIDGIAVTAIQVEQGSTLNLTVHARDNKALEKVTVTLMENTNSPTPPTGTYAFNQSQTTGSDHAALQFELSIPESIAAQMIAKIVAVDANGYTDQLEIPMIIINSQAPTIAGSSNPAEDANGEIHINAGQNLLMSGEANDADGLQSLSVMLWDANDQPLATTPIAITATPMAFSDASFDQAVSGRYRVVIEAVDNSGHRSYWGRFVIVD